MILTLNLILSPSACRAILASGAIVQNHGDLESALKKYRVAIQRIPDSGQIWNNIAMCFYGKKKFVAVGFSQNLFTFFFFKVLSPYLPSSTGWAKVFFLCFRASAA